jgi:hypothetical protein
MYTRDGQGMAPAGLAAFDAGAGFTGVTSGRDARGTTSGRDARGVCAHVSGRRRRTMSASIASCLGLSLGAAPSYCSGG